MNVGVVTAAATRLRILVTRALASLGLREDSFLILVAVLIGLVTAAAAVGFHQLIDFIRTLLYQRVGEDRLYGPWMFLLILWPSLGGLSVGIITRYFGAREGHGVVDVIESVMRSSGFIRPRVAIEKIVTSAITIGTGGAVGAEGPIIQIGAAIASGFGSVFRLARGQMPTIIGCGAAAGISAIFNSPMGGLLFALEVILQDFSIRSVTPIVVASVIANVATQGIFSQLFHENFEAIFRVPAMDIRMNWPIVGNYVVLGLVCGIVGVSLTRLMYFTEERFRRINLSSVIKPALGGAVLGVMGVSYVLIFGRLLAGRAKPVPFDIYPMPAFFGDGYGFIQLLLTSDFYQHTPYYLALLLAFLIFAKLVGTCITLSSGGSGGVIAPALFLGATAGGLLGHLMKMSGLFNPGLVQPEAYALVGMGAVLAAIVHAPLASILILLETTRNSGLMLPAMLSTVIATAMARIILSDSIYTLSLRRRGLNVSAGAEGSLLHRLTVEQVDLEPATILKLDDPFQRILELVSTTNASDFPVADEAGNYVGMVVSDDVRTAMLEREAIPLLLVEELLRRDVPVVKTTDDLAMTMDQFGRIDIGRLPVCFPGAPGRVIGMISRSRLMKRYQDGLAGKR
ncbi:MAG: chloride channel protein [Anaerolineae bacterium]|nr:chloride channel protein [Phycisphaerae bacterium]